MKENQIGTLVIKCMECVNSAVKEINSLGENKRKNATHFINATHNMGKYHGYMDILEKLMVKYINEYFADNDATIACVEL